MDALISRDSSLAVTIGGSHSVFAQAAMPQAVMPRTFTVRKPLFPSEHIIYDIDETIIHHAPEMGALFDHHITESVIADIQNRGEVIPPREIITEIGKASYKEHGLSLVLLAQQFGICALNTHINYHRPLIKHVDENWDEIAQAQPHAVEITTGSFNDLRFLDIQASALTHGSTEWGKYVIDKFAIEGSVRYTAGIDQYDMRLKSKDPSLFECHLARAQYKGEIGKKTPLVDDSLTNLKIASLKGIYTARIRGLDNKTALSSTGYLPDADFDTAVDFNHTMIALKRMQRVCPGAFIAPGTWRVPTLAKG